jgi:hypothetical protein
MKSTIDQIVLDLNTQKYTLQLSFNGEFNRISLTTADALSLLGSIETDIEIDTKKQLVYYVAKVN